MKAAHTRREPVAPLAETMQILDKRALNRALLARQGLLKRVHLSAIEAIERLGGMQAQAPLAPYYGLWARLEGFQQDELSSLLTEKKVVRMALMRSTLHLISAQDAVAWRPLLQPVLDRGLKGSFGKRLDGVALAEIETAARALLQAEPLSFERLGRQLQQSWPDREPAALAAAARTVLPLVQLPPRGLWETRGQAIHATAEDWLSLALWQDTDTDALLLRYLAAYGPASVKDMQTWSGLTRLRETIDRMLPQLVRFLDENGQELFDVPDAPRPRADTPAPVRFLGEFDNMLLSYSDRSRILDERYRQRVFGQNAIIRSVFLVDGFVQGIWRIEQGRGTASLLLEPFIELSSEDRASLAAEGEDLLQFACPKEHTFSMEWLPVVYPSS